MILRIQKEMTTTKLWEAKDKVDITLQQHLQVRFKVSRIFLAFLILFTISELQENLVKLQNHFSQITFREDMNPLIWRMLPSNPFPNYFIAMKCSSQFFLLFKFSFYHICNLPPRGLSSSKSWQWLITCLQSLFFCNFSIATYFWYWGPFQGIIVVSSLSKHAYHGDASIFPDLSFRQVSSAQYISAQHVSALRPWSRAAFNCL